MIKRNLLTLAILLAIATSSLYAGDKVIIGAYGNYPTASCQIENKYYLIPNGTAGEVLKWGSKYSEGQVKDIFAQIDMYEKSDVKLLSGPQKGKTCAMMHIYLQLK